MKKKIYIKGTFSGKYFALLDKGMELTYNEFYRMTIRRPELIIHAIAKDDESQSAGNPHRYPIGDVIDGPLLVNVPSSGKWYYAHIAGLTISHPKLKETTQEGEEHFGVLSGTVYGYIAKDIVVPDKTLPKPKPVSRPTPIPTYPCGEPVFTRDAGTRAPERKQDDPWLLRLALIVIFIRLFWPYTIFVALILFLWRIYRLIRHHRRLRVILIILGLVALTVVAV